MDVFGDLVAEQDRLERILEELDEDSWSSPSGAQGWTVTDVVLHLAQTEEAVVASVAAIASRDGSGAGDRRWRAEDETLDAAIERQVAAERAAPAVVFDRWRVARRAAVAALREADPNQRLPWAAAPLKPQTLATTRLAEHWAHGLDITEPLHIAFPDTHRLHHIAWLGHASLPYAFALVGQAPHEVFCTLTGPDGSTWRFGPPNADSTISGSAGEFCRVGARRLRPEDCALVTRGPHAAAALAVLRNYAG